TEQRGPGDARGEAGGAEARVLPEEAPLAGQEPDPAEPEGWQGQDHREQERTEELPATALEIEALPAEVRVRNHERPPLSQEERVVEPDREAGEERSLDEDLHDLDGMSPEGEADTPPGGAAQAIAAGPHHGHRNERQEQQRDQERRGPLDRRIDVEDV